MPLTQVTKLDLSQSSNVDMDAISEFLPNLTHLAMRKVTLLTPPVMGIASLVRLQHLDLRYNTWISEMPSIAHGQLSSLLLAHTDVDHNFLNSCGSLLPTLRALDVSSAWACDASGVSPCS